MTSVLNVDTIADKAGTGPVGLTKQHALKAWHKATDNATLNESFNISSGSDQGTGNYDYSFTNSMSSTDYSLTCNGSYAEIAEPEQSNTTASLYTVRTFGRQDSLTNADQRQSAQIAGDLA